MKAIRSRILEPLLQDHRGHQQLTSLEVILVPENGETPVFSKHGKKEERAYNH